MTSIKGIEIGSDIQLKITYGYSPNIRTITQTVSASILKQGLNSIKIEDAKLLKEIKANPELKLYPSLSFYPSLDPTYTNIVNNATPGQVYYPPSPKSIHLSEEELLEQLFGLGVFANDTHSHLEDNSVIKEANRIDAIIQQVNCTCPFW